MFTQKEALDTVDIDELFQQYLAKDDEFKGMVNFQTFVEISKRNNHTSRPSDKKELQQKMKMPMFDGGERISARAWLQKLQTYLSLNPMDEDKVVQFASLCLEGSAYDWWHHGLNTQGHKEIHTFDEFSIKVLDRFEQKDEEEYFRKLATLKQSTTVSAYIEEFHKIAVMVPYISKKRLVFLFIEGLLDLIRGFVKAFEPPSLQVATRRALSLEVSMPTKTFKSNMLGSSPWKGQ